MTNAGAPLPDPRLDLDGVEVRVRSAGKSGRWALE